MLKRGVLLASLLLAGSSAAAQSPMLIRYHDYYHDSSRVVDANTCYFVRGAHVNQKEGLPLRIHDLVPAETDLIFFETTHDEVLILAFEIKKGITKHQVNSAQAGAAVWLTNFYRMSRRQQETRDFVTGELTLRPVSNSEIVVNGQLNIDSEYPGTHQEIVFNQSKLKISTLAEITNRKADEEEQIRKQDKLIREWASIRIKESKYFWDSLFSMKEHPGNTIEATINGNVLPDIELRESAIFLDSELTGEAAPRFIMFDKFNGVIGEDVLQVADGSNRVVLLCFTHDEAKYCVGIEMDKANDPIKAVVLYRDNELVISAATRKSVKITKDETKSVSGTIDLDFEGIRLTGSFELPKLQQSDIRNLEVKIKKKQQDYLSSTR